jgi:Fe-S cluster assembly iron-binding protein IscA
VITVTEVATRQLKEILAEKGGRAVRIYLRGVG